MRATLATILACGVGLATLASRPARAEGQHREGDYGGVTPGHRPAHEQAPARRPQPGSLTWIGFAAKDGGAELYFQSGGPFEVTQGVEGDTLVVHLGGIKRQLRNTRRPIETRFFDNPIARISATPARAQHASKGHPAQRAGVEARITFKNPRDVREGTMRTATEADGMFYVYLSFPEGSGPDPVEPAAPTVRPPGADDDRPPPVKTN